MQFPGHSFAELMTRLHQGDQEAATRIFQTFSQRLVALARSRLHGLIRAKTDPDLLEWNYGDYEGRKSSEILAERPGWLLFRDGCPNGEQPADVGARADRVIARLRATDDRAIVFSSGHILRVLTARWLGLPPSEGRLFMLSTASVSVLGYEHHEDAPAIQLWNEA